MSSVRSSNRLTLLPVISEKAMALIEASRTYTFLVPKYANKLMIARAISDQFQLTPAGINLLVSKGKPQRTLVQRGRRRVNGNRADVKKAYVTLRQGDKIQLFEETK